MLKLILADNQAIFRAGIAKVLAVEDEMRIVAQAQTPEQMFMALDKFRAAVLVAAAGFHNDFAAIVQAANKAKTRVIVLADTGDAQRTWLAAPMAWSTATSPAQPWWTACAKSLAAKLAQDVAGSELTENDMVGCACAMPYGKRAAHRRSLCRATRIRKCHSTRHHRAGHQEYLRNVYDCKIGVSDRLELALFTIHHRILNEAPQPQLQCAATAGSRP
jgi:hypothetical protein